MDIRVVERNSYLRCKKWYKNEDQRQIISECVLGRVIVLAHHTQ